MNKNKACYSLLASAIALATALEKTGGDTTGAAMIAALEGLTFELRSNLEVLQNSSIYIQEMRAIGGGARSKYWLQLKADITGIPVVVPRITEAASWGAGILGGIAAGHFSNFQQLQTH